MEMEEDMIMIIVGEGTEASDHIQPINIKKEVENEDTPNDGAVEDTLDLEKVEHYLEAAEKYGEVVPVDCIKREAEDGGTEPDEADEDYLEDFTESDEEYLVKKPPKKKAKTVADLRKSNKKPTPNPTPNSLRRRMLLPEERKSFVRELIVERPELKSDQEKLVETLAQIMQNTKPPPPPDGFCDLDVETLQYSCNTCDHTFTNSGAMVRHYQLTHGDRYLVCFACGVDFRDITNLYKHEKRCEAPEATIVLKARAISVGAKGRRRPYLPPRQEKKPQKWKRKEKKLQCSYCPARFSAALGLDAHENLHRGERPYLCDYCMVPYGSYMALLRHRKGHEDIKFICDHCGSVFKSKVTIRMHLECHNPVPRYKCEHCGKRYSQKLALQLHVRKQHLHLPPPCACQLCPKRFGRMSVLKVHMKKAHGLDLITKNMYIKSLPKLTDMELEQAKVIMKSEIGEFPPVVIQPSGQQNVRTRRPNATPKKQRKVTPNKQHKVIPNKRPKVTPNKQKKVTPRLNTPMVNKDKPVITNIVSNIENIQNNNQQKVIVQNNDQQAVIVQNIDQQNVIVESNDHHKLISELQSNDDEECENQIIVDISDTDLSAEVLQFVQKLQAENKEKVVLLDHGKIVHLVDNESDALKLMEELKDKQGSVEIEDLTKMETKLFENVTTEDNTYVVVENEIKPELNDNDSKGRVLMDAIEAQLREMEADSAPQNSKKILYHTKVLENLELKEPEVEKKKPEVQNKDILSENKPLSDDKKENEQKLLEKILVEAKEPEVQAKPLGNDKTETKAVDALKSRTRTRNKALQNEKEIISPKPKPSDRKRKIENVTVEIEVENTSQSDESDVNKEGVLRRSKRSIVGSSMPDLA